MIIVWGKKVRSEPRGQGIVFCPVCREPSIGSVRTIRQTGHVYWIPVGRGDHIADEFVCRGCDSRYAFPAGSLTAFAGPIASVQAGLDSMPSGRSAAIRVRAEIEQRVAQRAVSSSERLDLIAEPFLALTYEHQLQVARSTSQSVSAVIQLLMIVGIFASVILWFDASGNRRMYPWAYGVSAATGLLTLIVLYRSVAQNRRAASRTFVTRLAGAIKPLTPTVEELETVLSGLRARKVALAAIPLVQLRAAIESMP